MKQTTKCLLAALQSNGLEVVGGKGGFWIKGRGFITIAKARQMTGIKAPKRQFRGRISAYGDWATIAAINGVKE